MVTPNGMVLARNDDGTVTTACSAISQIEGKPLQGAHVVIDPGHGGEESGAVGPTGLLEKDVNLAVAQETKRILEATGATVVLTRSADYRITIVSRAAIATRLRPLVMVSIHHNAVGGAVERPGNEVYHQHTSPESKRLAGLVFEEVTEAFADHAIAWHGSDAIGAGARLNPQGTDYYGILRRSAGVPSVLSEAAYISNAPEEALLKTAAFQHEEAQAIADAIVRYVTTEDPGSGFIAARTQPIRPGGGGSEGCEEPAY